MAALHDRVLLALYQMKREAYTKQRAHHQCDNRTCAIVTMSGRTCVGNLQARKPLFCPEFLVIPLRLQCLPLVPLQLKARLKRLFQVLGCSKVSVLSLSKRLDLLHLHAAWAALFGLHSKPGRLDSPRCSTLRMARARTWAWQRSSSHVSSLLSNFAPSASKSRVSCCT
jgi:hypothetical protein